MSNSDERDFEEEAWQAAAYQAEQEAECKPYVDIWVCTDCYLAHQGCDDYLYSGGLTPDGRKPFGLWEQDHHITDNSETGEGIDEFSWRPCSGCGSTHGGSRYRMAVWED